MTDDDLPRDLPRPVLTDAELDRALAALRSDVPNDPGRLDAVRTGLLATADAIELVAEPADPLRLVAEPSARRARRRPGWLAAAVVVAVLGVAVATALRSGVHRGRGRAGAAPGVSDRRE